MSLHWKTASARADEYANVPKSQQFRKMSAYGYRAAGWCAAVGALCFAQSSYDEQTSLIQDGGGR
jgi:hypothetical protein